MMEVDDGDDVAHEGPRVTLAVCVRTGAAGGGAVGARGASSSARSVHVAMFGEEVVAHAASTEKRAKRSCLDVYAFDDSLGLEMLEGLVVRIKNEASTIVAVYFEEGAADVERLLTRAEVPLAPKRRLAAAKRDDVLEALRALTGGDASGDPALACPDAAWALLYHEDLASDEALRGAVQVRERSLAGCMRLDAGAMEALNLFPPEGAARNGRDSVFGVLNHCVTRELGARLLRRWLCQPLVSVPEIEARQDLVQALKDDDARRDAVRLSLRNMVDVEKLVRKLEAEGSAQKKLSGRRTSLKDLYLLYEFARAVPELAAAAADPAGGDAPAPECLRLLGKEARDLCGPECLAKYVELVESMLNMKLVPREFRVQAQHDETGRLAGLERRLEGLAQRRDELREQLEGDELAGMQPRFESDAAQVKTHGFHFRVHKKHDQQLKKLKGAQYKYLAVVNAGIRWTSTALEELHAECVSVLGDVDDAQAVLVQQAAAVAATFAPLFRVAADVVARADVLASLAHAAAYAPTPYERPALAALDAPERARGLHIKEARHPCLEHLDGIDFIANDYDFDREASRFQIVTGPNMGGKSTHIRQLGALCVMAQLGSFLPCAAGAKVPVVDAVLARVGASDEQLRGVSTFMAEMLDAASILHTATDKSLVIIDELGRGTSTYDGFGLAWAISEHLALKTRPFALFATHFHELTDLANTPGAGVVNKHVQAMYADGELTMLYNLEKGPSLQSFGINIAHMAGFPADVIDVAKRKAAQLEVTHDDKAEAAVKQLAALNAPPSVAQLKAIVRAA